MCLSQLQVPSLRRPQQAKTTFAAASNVSRPDLHGHRQIQVKGSANRPRKRLFSSFDLILVRCPVPRDRGTTLFHHARRVAMTAAKDFSASTRAFLGHADPRFEQPCRPVQKSMSGFWMSSTFWVDDFYEPGRRTSRSFLRSYIISNSFGG